MPRPIDHSTLREFLKYEPDTGRFFRLKTSSPRSRVGDRADINKGDGYYRVKVLSGIYSAHRLAWFYVHGVWPDGEIDHINHDPSDNRIENLRDVSKHLNQQNLINPKRRNKSGYLGVWKNKTRWGARIRLDGRDCFIGNFETPQQAHAAYLLAKREFHPGNTL